jgi:predicted alpha/beta hydrolase family esterase
MKQQIVVLHGGGIYSSHKEFLNTLKQKEISLERLRQKRDWKSNLQKTLGKTYDVLVPSMPNRDNAKYKEWKMWFEKLIPLFDEEVIFIGHSLGALFLLKYFSEETYTKHIKALFFVGAPFNSEAISFAKESGFVLTKKLPNLTEKTNRMYFYHSKDDRVVPFESYTEFKKVFPKAKGKSFTNRGHFNDETFPEIIDAIKKMK